jgi:hypothetical protein
MKKIILLILIIILVIIGNFYFKSIEKFSTSSSLGGSYPKSEDEYLLQDSYQKINEIGISNNGSNDIWWNFPIFKLGSYAQITNNIRYPDNPDEGTCMPASMCGALYQPKEILGPHNYGVNDTGDPLQLNSNYSKPLPPVELNKGTRVGYFITNSNLSPFIRDSVNVLY